MAVTTDTPPPQPQMQIPQIAVTLIMLLAGFVKSPWLHTILTTIATSFGTSMVLESKISSLLAEVPPSIRKRLIPPPTKPADAIGQTRFGNSGCTASIIGPIYSDDNFLNILTAAHCMKLGDKGQMKLKDGRVLAVKCVTRDADADCAWLQAGNPGGNIPYLLLADESPEPGSKVWHQGYGIDKPGNKEIGQFRGVTASGKQCEYTLSVSPGDSGGAIVLDAHSRVLSPVCCTTRLGAKGDVWGATPQACAAIKPSVSRSAAEPPLIYPVLPLQEEFEWESPTAFEGEVSLASLDTIGVFVGSPKGMVVNGEVIWSSQGDCEASECKKCPKQAASPVTVPLPATSFPTASCSCGSVSSVASQPCRTSRRPGLLHRLFRR